jgi:hypothetical protein
MGKHMWMAVGLVALIGVSACSGSSKHSSSTSTTTTAPGSTGSTTSSTVKPSGDAALAQAAALTASDVPADWQSEPAAARGSADAELAKCLAVSAGALNNNGVGEFDSPTFATPSAAVAMSISSSVRYTSNAAAAEAEFHLFSDPRVPGCLTSEISTGLESGLPAGVTVQKTTVTPLTLPPFASQTVAYRVAVPLKTQTITLTITDDVILVRKGRAGVEMNFQSSGVPFTATQEERYTRLVVGRMKNT